MYSHFQRVSRINIHRIDRLDVHLSLLGLYLAGRDCDQHPVRTELQSPVECLQCVVVVEPHAGGVQGV